MIVRGFLSGLGECPGGDCPDTPLAIKKLLVCRRFTKVDDDSYNVSSMLCKMHSCDDDSSDNDADTSRDEANDDNEDIVTSSNNNICSLPVDIGNCKSYQV